MYHRNIVGVNAAKYTRESPLPISNGGTFNSTAASFSASLKANKTYYYDAECDGYMGKWMKAKDGASAKLMRIYLVSSDGSVRTTSGKPGVFTPTTDGTYYFEVQSADASQTMHVWNFSVVEYSDKVEYAPNPDAVDAGSGEIKIFRPKSKQTEANGSALGIFPLLSTSVHKKEFMGSDCVTLQWDDTCVPSEEVLSIPLGSYIIVDGMKFRCITQYTPQQSDELTWHYEVEFHAPVSALSVKPFFFYMDDLCETEFSINGEFKEFTDALTTAIYKSTGETWTITAPDDLGTQALTFSQATIFDALGDIAEAFDVEWMATENSITFLEDATSSNERTLNVGIDIAAPSSSNSDEDYYNRYYAFGSTRNIVSSDYSTLNASVTSLSEARLKLPTSSWTDTDGTVYPACPFGYVDYADDSSTDDLERNACVKVYDDIYPQSDLEVTEVTSTTKKNDDDEQYPVYTLKMKATSDGSVFKVENSTYNKDGNPDGMLISGLTISINFTSGLLQGKEFELGLSANGKEFTIVPDTSEDIMVPNNLILPQVGDKCIIFNIRMPDSYRASAEHKLYKQLMEDIAEAHSANAELTLTSYPTAGIASIDVADKILIKNGKQTVSTRVASFEQCLDIPSSWTITTGDGVQTSKVKTLTETINDVKGIATTASKAGVLANRAAYKASQELIEQVFDPDGDFFTETIKPLVVQTANVTVGTKSQQFVIDNLIFGFNNGESEGVSAYFYASARDSSITPALHHYAIDPDNVRTWNFDKSYKVSYGGSTSALGSAFSFSADTAGCYIYAVCPRFDGVEASTELNGTLLLTDQQILAEPASDNDNYYFLLGMLSSEITTNGFISRNVTLTYGETAINGRNITTGRIQSADGNAYFDLDTGEFHGNFSFTASSDNTAVINSIINANSTVTSAASNASSALSTATTAASDASTAKSTATSASTTANNALTTANTANTTATTANATLANFQVGGRNLLKNSAKTYTLNYTSSTNASIEIPLVDAAKNMTFSDAYTFAWLSFYVDGWTETYVPNFNGWNFGTYTANTSGWEWWGWSSSDVSSGYIQINSTTRRYWFKIKSNGYKLLRCFLYSNNTKGTPDSGIPKVYNVMLSFGAALTDYAPAQEDVDSSISTAQSTATTASANASTALSTANEVAANAQGRNLLRGTQGMTIGAGTWETATFSRWAGQGTMQTLTQTEIATFTGESVPYDVKTSGILLTPVIDSSTSTYHKEEAFQQDCRNQSGLFKAGETLTFSAYVWANQAMLLRYIHNANVSSDYQIVNYQLAKGWNKVSITYTATTPAQILMYYSYKNALTTQPYMIWANLKLERGSTATMWTEAPEDTDARIAETDYLRESLEEAAASTTDLTGGLVLSKYIGVKNASGTVVAGMSGTSAAVNNTLPMIWAGASANTDAAMRSAKFRVQNSGHVEMNDVVISQGTSTKYLNIADNAMSLVNGSYKTVVSSESIGSIATATSKSTTSTTKTVASGTKALVVAVQDASSMTQSGTYHFFTHTTTNAATLDISAFSVKFTTDMDNQEPSSVPTGYTLRSNASYSKCSFNLQLTVGSTVYSLTSLNQTAVNTITTETVSVAATQIIVPAGTSVSLDLAFNFSCKVYKWIAEYTDQEGDTQTVELDGTGTTVEAQAYFPTAFTGKFTEGEYRNNYYADGFFLQSASTKYFGVNSYDSATLMQARFGAALFKFTSNGLLQSLNGSTFYRVNPLVAIIKLAFKEASNTGYTATYLYRIKGSTTPTTKREATGNVVLTHYLKTNTGVSSYTAQGTYYCTGSTEYARTLVFDDIAVDSMRVHFMTGNAHFDPQNTGNVDYAMIFFYDYGTY